MKKNVKKNVKKVHNDNKVKSDFIRSQLLAREVEREGLRNQEYMLGICMNTLYSAYGFREKRLKQFIIELDMTIDKIESGELTREEMGRVMKLGDSIVEKKL